MTEHEMHEGDEWQDPVGALRVQRVGDEIILTLAGLAELRSLTPMPEDDATVVVIGMIDKESS